MEENRNRNQNNEEEYETYESWGTIENAVNVGSAARPVFGTAGSGYSAVVDGRTVEERQYLLTIIGCLVWGFFVNFLMCITLGKSLANSMNPQFLYLVVPMQLVSVLMNVFSKKAITKFIAYNLLVVPMGLEIAYVVGVIAEVGLMEAVTMALLGTLIIGGVMFGMAYVKPEIFLSLGKTLCYVTLAVIPAALLVMIFAPAAYAAFDVIFILIFALWLGFDISRAMAQPKSTANAITAAFDVYYDLAYIFLRLLLIMAKNSSKK